jgi:glutamate dehydrogenase/leucine dehydrogenase
MIFAKVGYHAAYLAKKLFGCKVVAVSDIMGAIYSEEGLDPEIFQDTNINRFGTGLSRSK